MITFVVVVVEIENKKLGRKEGAIRSSTWGRDVIQLIGGGGGGDRILIYIDNKISYRDSYVNFFFLMSRHLLLLVVVVVSSV